ncbi:hypothetical protein FGO68_gene16792 [Halteria grandinella]|uniref:Uncharacterized protein n=1 Tax=Halteria grandinella TaxID=5974 RepID=A0A8J8NX49_HALGN|nr:hypothetical protein FGO68_gene16792 [Halteria grandinella]
MIEKRVNENAQGFIKLFSSGQEHDVLKELHSKFRMPVEEVLARKKREAEAIERKRRMTLGSNALFAKLKETIATAEDQILKQQRRFTLFPTAMKGPDNADRKDSLTQEKIKATIKDLSGKQRRMTSFSTQPQMFFFQHKDTNQANIAEVESLNSIDSESENETSSHQSSKYSESSDISKAKKFIRQNNVVRPTILMNKSLDLNQINQDRQHRAKDNMKITLFNDNSQTIVKEKPNVTSKLFDINPDALKFYQTQSISPAIQIKGLRSKGHRIQQKYRLVENSASTGLSQSIGRSRNIQGVSSSLNYSNPNFILKQKANVGMKHLLLNRTQMFATINRTPLIPTKTQFSTFI